MPVVNTGNAAHYVWGEVCEGWRLLDRTDLSVIQERIPPGRGEVRHYHERAHQLFFVLEGALTIEIDGEAHHVAVRDSLEVPPTRRHRVRNDGAVDAAFLVISAPTTQGDRVNVGD